MEYTVLGKTGARISRIGFGGAAAGLKNYLGRYDPEEESSKQEIYRALEIAIENGINYFDTAPGYGNGKSEIMFGHVLQYVNPTKVFLATKCSAFGDKPQDDFDHVMRSVEGSLKRLKRNYLDLLQLHGNSYTEADVSRLLAPHGSIEALEKLKKDGLIRFVGFTTEDNNKGMYDLFDTGRFDTVQMCYNFIFQHPYEPSRPFGSLYEAEKKD